MLFLRSLGFNIIMFTACFAASFWAKTTARFQNKDHILQMGQLWARITLRALKRCCGIDIVVHGKEFLPTGGPALIAAQHQSAFDILFWLTAVPRPAYVLKQELLKIPLFGPLLPRAGFVVVDRQAGAPAMRKMVAECRIAIADGRQIIIFPEGTRRPFGERGTIQPGILALARVLKIPVIPAATNSGRHWGRKSFRKYPGTISVTLHAPIAQAAAHRSLLTQLEQIYYGESVDNSVY